HLAKVRQRFFVPREYELHVPLPRHHSYDAFPDGFGLLIDSLKGGLRFLLHPVIKYFAAQVFDLPGLQVGAPMKACWTDLLILVHFWDEGLIATEYARGTLHPSIVKQLYSAP
ncbi:hypothetical protein B296_00057410, partial [Ensete ventricosum]